MTDTSDYSFFPVRHPKLLEFYTKQKNVFWTPQEIDMSSDREDWDNLDEPSQRFIKFVLCFFAQADGIVIENIMERFQEETSKWKEAKAFYTMQNAMEMIHNETYSLLIETFITNHEEKAKAFNAIQHYPSIGNIASWMIKWLKSDQPLTKRVIAFACVEGVLFSGAFAAIYWIKRKNILHGLTKANEFIARDEGIHKDFGVALYHHLVNEGYERLSEAEVYEIVDESIEVSEKFIREALQVELIGMNADDMIKYVKCTADSLISDLGYEKRYREENPFEWMVSIGITNKTNFFEERVSEYAKPSTGSFTFKVSDDF